MKRALVTGSSGFVGRHMMRRLHEQAWGVTPCDIKNNHDMMDMFDPRATTRFDLVVHCAARAPHRQGIDELHGAFPYNVGLDAALFEWAIRTQQPRVIYISSSAVYPDELQGEHDARFDHPDESRLPEVLVDVDNWAVLQPHDDYGWTKILGERMARRAREAGVNVTVVRPFSGYGENQSINFPFGAFIARALRQEDPFVIWGALRQVRDWIHIDDVVDATLVLAEANVTEPVNLCTGVGTSMHQLAEFICTAVGYRPVITVDTEAPLGVFRRVGDPTRLNKYYHPRITLNEGVARALKE